MITRRFIYITALISILFSAITGGSGCANIIPPSGGPKDSLPPVLLRVSPPDSTMYFQDTRISFSFDEYVEVDEYMKNVIVSPLPANIPNVSRKLQTVNVRLRDTLEENTTYTINFGKAIRDVNEGNVLEDFTYTFTTGGYFDSLKLRGNVKIAETGEVDSTLTIILHRTGIDSAVYYQRPRYITKTDGRGNFEFRNLPPDTFYVYALQDESGSYRYLNTENKFAFADSAVIVSAAGQPPVNLSAYSIVKPATTQRTTAGGARGRAVEKRLKFSTNVKAEQDLLDSLVLTFEVPLREFDSTRIRLATDSAYTPVTDARWTLDTARSNLTLHNKWQENTEYHLVLEKDFATDTLGQQLLKTDTINFTTSKISDYGKLAIRFRNLDLSQNPVLLFVQGDQVVRSYPLNAATFNVAMIKPGEYRLRILYDRNGNGKWDPGTFFVTRRQPETVKPVQRQITIRNNWDNQFEIDINATAESAPRENRTQPAPRQRVQPSTPTRTRPPKK